MSSIVAWRASAGWKRLLGDLSQWHGARSALTPATERAGQGRSWPLRVLFVHDHLGQTLGLVHGVTRYLVSTLPAFDRAAVEPVVCVLTPRHPIGAPMLEAEGIEPIFLARGKWDPRAVLDLIRLVRAHEIDVVHVSGLKASMLGRVAALATGRASVVHIHDARPMPPWVRLIERRLAAYTDMAVAVSQAMRRTAIEDYGMPPERVRVLYNGVLSEAYGNVPADAGRRMRQELGLARDARVIGIVGRVEPGKGVRLLLRAMPAVLAACPTAALLVVGDGPTREESKRLAAELGIAAAVRFTGYRGDVPELLAAMEVMAAPSTAEQGLGYAVLEAMSAGVPVVASRCGGPAECVVHDESGLLVPMADAAALAQALIRVLGDARLREKLGEAARARSALFSVARHVVDLQAIYRDIVAAPVRQGRAARGRKLQVMVAEGDGDHSLRA